MHRFGGVLCDTLFEVLFLLINKDLTDNDKLKIGNKILLLVCCF